MNPVCKQPWHAHQVSEMGLRSPDGWVNVQENVPHYPASNPWLPGGLFTV